MSDLSKEQPTVPEPDNPKPLRILIAEDDARVAELLQAYYSKGNVVDMAVTADEALEKLDYLEEGEEYDLLVTDKGLDNGDEALKDKDGFYFISEMNKKKPGNRTFKAMYSGSAPLIAKDNPGDMLAQKGVNNLIEKPSPKQVLLDLIPKVRQWQQRQQ